MSEHHASVMINAPVQQVYTFFTHFNDFPKFMSFVKEVTYYDDQRSHWVAQVNGTHEWDAVNDDWVPNQQIGWHSINGLKNRGMVRFTPLGSQQTNIDVYITYEPPAGPIGKAIDQLGLTNFDEILQKDLNHFAVMVEQAPAGALDPMQSHYLFHDESAVARKQSTERQNVAMSNDPMMTEQALRQRENNIRQEQTRAQQSQQQESAALQQRALQQAQASAQQSEALHKQAERDRQEAIRLQQQDALTSQNQEPTAPDPVHDTIGGRNASKERTAFGDQDGSQRFPGYETDPMTARRPSAENGETTPPAVANTSEESPWRTSIVGIDTPEARAERERMQDEELKRQEGR